MCRKLLGSLDEGAGSASGAVHLSFLQLVANPQSHNLFECKVRYTLERSPIHHSANTETNTHSH